MRVLVCGGRDFKDYALLARGLDLLHSEVSFSLVIDGGARGADTLANLWARRNRVERKRFMARWDLYGKRAGPMRNQQMLDEGKPDLVVAFPGGDGTADMVRRATNAGVRVIKVAG